MLPDEEIVGGDSDELAEAVKQVEATMAEGETPEPVEPVEPTEAPLAPAEAPQIPEPLEHWTQLQKDQFTEIPDELKGPYIDQVKNLDATYDTKFQDIARQKETLDSLNQIFSPIDNVLTTNGVSRTQAIQELVGWYQQLQTDPMGTLTRLAQQYNVSLNQDPGDEFSDPSFEDPRLSQVQQEIGQLRGLLQQNFSNQQAQNRGVLQTQIDAFAAAKNPDGSLVNPYFADVREEMGHLSNANPAWDLATLYGKAIWSHPDVRTKVMEAQQKEAAKKQEEERKKATAKAKKADAVNVDSSPEATKPAKKPRTVREDVEAAAKEMATA